MSAAAPATIWDRVRLGITVGSVALIFLDAVEALAMTTVMPVVSADLNGQTLFAIAFSGTLATGVIGMVAAGAWSDRTGPKAPLFTAVALFMAGLLVSGAATDMYTFVVGRLIQGLGVGAQIVALYVLVARVYPRELHGRIFAAFAAAWVVPSMVGPFLAGVVTEFLHWRWVFLGVAALTAVAFLLVMANLRRTPLGASAPADGIGPSGERTADPVEQDESPSRGAIGVRLLLSAVVAAAAIGAGFAAEAPAAIAWLTVPVCIAVICLALRPLVPPGTLRSRAGLPSVVLLRGLIAGAFFAAESYVPRLLMEGFEFGPMLAGLSLTAAGLAWSLGSFVQGKHGERMGSRRITLISIPLLLLGVLILLAITLSGSMPWLVLLGWGIAGGGIGLLYPRLSVLTLAYSSRANEGFNSSALSISDSTGSAVTLAVAGLAFLTLPLAGSGFATVFALAAAVLVVALIPGLRLGDGPR